MASNDYDVLEDKLESEKLHADELAEMLRFAIKYLPDPNIGDDSMHIISITGTQITTGMILNNALSNHERRRSIMEDE